VSSQKGAELPLASPEYEWVARVIRSVERRTGSPTRWNGRVFEEMDTGILGAAHADGSMTVSASKVLAPVRLAYTGGRPLTNQESLRARDAAATVAHEAVHLSSRYGNPNAPGAYPTHDDASRAIEEGQAEHWTHRNLDGVIADVGLDRAAPGVLTQPTMDAYPAYTHAAANLNRGLADRTGQTSDQVASKLIGTERAQRWNAVADMVIDSRLAGLMPASHRDFVRQQVVAPVRKEFETLPAAQADRSLSGAQKATAAKDAATRTLASMDQAVGHIQQHYENWYQQEAQQAGQQIISVQPGQQQFSQQVAARVEAGSSSEVAKLRALMSGQAPASSAPNSSAGHRDGARPNGGPTPGQQVTRPQRGPNQPLSSQRD
jgi:hypothetical protein